MGAPVTVRFSGLKELRASLNSLEPKMQRKILRRVLRKQSKAILVAIKASMPKSDSEGVHLVDALKVRAGKSRRGYMSDGLVFPERSVIDIDENDPYYWPFALEYGHATPGRGSFSNVSDIGKKGRSKGKVLRRRRGKAPKDVAPRPYVRQAWDHREALAGAQIEQDTFRELEKMWASKK